LREINDLDFLDGAELIVKAYEKREEDRAFKLYTAQYAWMNESNFVSFDDFINRARSSSNQQSVDEILSDVAEILNSNKGRWA